MKKEAKNISIACYMVASVCFFIASIASFIDGDRTIGTIYLALAASNLCLCASFANKPSDADDEEE